MKNRLIFSLFMLLPLVASAQKTTWGVDFLSFFDNREYDSHYAISETYFGTRITPQLSVSVGEGQKLVAGAGFLLENGKKPMQQDPDYLAYYQAKTKAIGFLAGYFPRSKMMGNFPNIFLRSTLDYYHPNMSGLLIQKVASHGFAEIGIDWNGMRTDSVRESFLILSDGKYLKNQLYVGYHFSYFHFARAWNAPASQHLADNSLIHLFAGVQLMPHHLTDSAYIQGGFVQGANRLRGTDVSESPKGLYAEIYYKHDDLGVKNSFYFGNHQMNLYHAKDEKGVEYGERVYWNDPYFQSNCYNRTEFFWNIAQTKHTTVQLSSIHHFDGKSFGWQQVLSVKVKI